MTTSTWTDQEIRSQFAECKTLHEIINRIEEDFSLRGEVICEIRVNGVALSEGDEAKFASSPSKEISQLSVRSNRPADLVEEAMASALQFVPELEASCLKTAESFRGADLVVAQKLFHDCLEGCQWLVDTLLHLRVAAAGVQAPLSEPERWFEAEKIITKVVRELSESYSKSDFVLVADLLEYELTGALAIWRSALELEIEKRARMAGPHRSDDQSENSVGRRR